MRYAFEISALIFCAALIYFLVGRIDSKYSKRYQNNMDLLRISCISKSHLRVIQKTMDYCSATNPQIFCSISSGHGKAIIRQLMHGKTDIILIPETDAVSLNNKSPYLRVSQLENANVAYIDYLELYDSERETTFYLLWNHSSFSESRDRFLVSVKNDFQLLTCGYCDY